jgi:hypothetical protein
MKERRREPRPVVIISMEQAALANHWEALIKARYEEKNRDGTGGSSKSAKDKGRVAKGLPRRKPGKQKKKRDPVLKELF